MSVCWQNFTNKMASFYFLSTVDGRIYMWGKNCHVMNARQPSSFSYFEPVAIQTHYTIGKLACGVWHAVAITGKPGEICMLLK